jgi:hypothetical protein
MQMYEYEFINYMQAQFQKSSAILENKFLKVNEIRDDHQIGQTKSEISYAIRNEMS